MTDREALAEIIATNYGESQCHEETMRLAADALRGRMEREDGCELCDGDKSCRNCYYGQTESKDYGCDCDPYLSGWKPFGDAYCRKCGRRLIRDGYIHTRGEGYDGQRSDRRSAIHDKR